MTKQQYLDRYFELVSTFPKVYERITSLEEQGYLTYGAAFIVYNPYEIYSYKQVGEILDKATKAKSYMKYIRRVSIPAWRSLINGIEEELNTILKVASDMERLVKDGFLNVYEEELPNYTPMIPCRYDIWKDGVGNASIQLNTSRN